MQMNFNFSCHFVHSTICKGTGKNAYTQIQFKKNDLKAVFFIKGYPFIKVLRG